MTSCSASAALGTSKPSVLRKRQYCTIGRGTGHLQRFRRAFCQKDWLIRSLAVQRSALQQQQKPAATARMSKLWGALRTTPIGKLTGAVRRGLGRSNTSRLAATSGQRILADDLAPTAARSRDKGQRSRPAGAKGRMRMSKQGDHMRSSEGVYCTAHHRRSLRSGPANSTAVFPVLGRARLAE